MPKKIGIVGARRRNTNNDYKALCKAITEVYEEGDILVSGGCKLGADHFAEMIAEDRGYSILIHHANWKRYGEPAGPIRNSKIAKDVDVLIALPAGIGTGGTDDTIRKCKKLKKKVILI